MTAWTSDWLAPEPTMEVAPPEEDLLALRLEMVLTALDSLAQTLRDMPTPQVFIDAPDLSAIVSAVNGLKPGADADEIAQAVVRQIAPTAQKPEPDAIYSELVKTLEKLDFRLRAPSASSGLVSDISDRATRQLGNVNAQGNSAAGATDTGNPVKIGGRYSAATPTPVTDGQRTDAWFDAFGRQTVVLQSAELNTSNQLTSLRDLQTASRYTVLADSVADGLAGFWSAQTTGSGVAAAVAGGEGTLQTSAAASSSSSLISPVMRYYPGQSAWLNSAIRFPAGVAGMTARVGPVTVTGTTPQDGPCYELVDGVFYAVVYKGGAEVTRMAAAAWSRAAASPFTIDANYHSYEFRWTANGVQFYIDNVVKHVYAGTSSTISNSLNFPMTLQVINTTSTTNSVLGVRNIGLGRFGTPPPDVKFGVYGGATGTTSGTVSVPAGAWVTGIAVQSGTSAATVNIPAIGNITVPGSNQQSTQLALNPPQGTLVGPFSISITNPATYTIEWVA